ncbi:MAG: MogA/MoaB family molybdenum cofactor biosynthesis protein [bacterium]|nr:MogA/MoaB family molybdenum cofactor biosynthesis protein [bacterium]
MAHHDHGKDRSAGIALLSVSDTRTPETDRSGKRARELCEERGHAIVDYALLPDEPQRVRECVRRWLDRAEIDVVIVGGGTGISVRDTTYEALAGLLDKRLDGFGELFRMLSWEQVSSRAMLSRAMGGIARGKVLFSLPGSTPAVELALTQLILPQLGHLLAELHKHEAGEA